MPREFISRYTRDLTSEELGKLFTRETPEAYRFFARGINTAELEGLPWHKKTLRYAQGFFLAFTMRLSPARRLMYGVSLAFCVIGLLQLFAGFGLMRVPIPIALFFVNIRVPAPLFANGTLWLLGGFLLLNLLVLLEVADRLSLKNDLEIARQIQQAMLPRGAYQAPELEAFGMTRPANTVGGDFYDILPLPDGRVLLALGDVAGKGSPAALLMALLLAMLRTLVDEGLEGAELVARLNTQIVKHAPGTRFITLFLATLDPATGEMRYVNAGQNPPLLRRAAGSYERLREGGMALGMFQEAAYKEGCTTVNPGDVIVMYSDGITEAEDGQGQPFDEAGVERTTDAGEWGSARELGWALFAAVQVHTEERRLLDDLTVLIARRLPPLPPVVA